MDFQLPDRWLHPEGIFPAQLVKAEEAKGNYGARMRWIWETAVERDDGKPAQLSYFTGQVFGNKSNLVAMVMAMGIPVPTTPDELAKFKPDALIGMRVQIEVRHKLQQDGTTWAQIETFAPLRKQAAPVAAPPAATAPTTAPNAAAQVQVAAAPQTAEAADPSDDLFSNA